MLSEVIKISSPSNGGLFVDCTLGGGGYSKKLLEFPKTKVIAIDKDSAVISIAAKLQKKFQKRFEFYQSKFSQIDRIIKRMLIQLYLTLGFPLFNLVI